MEKLNKKIEQLRKELSDFDKSVQWYIDAQQNGLMWLVELLGKICADKSYTEAREALYLLNRLEEVRSHIENLRIEQSATVDVMLTIFLGDILDK